VEVYEIRMTKPYSETAPEIHLTIQCGGGTYIRRCDAHM